MFSGGKDSTFAVHWAFLHGFDVCCLVTLRPYRSDSWMFHFPCVDVTRLQAEAFGLPQIFVETSGLKNQELDDLKRALAEAKAEFGIDGVVAGALLSDYQRMNIALICEELGLRTYTPLWRKNQENYMRELVRYGFKIVITSISVYGLSPRLLGKILTEDDVEDIIRKAREIGFNPAFEGGEAETLVVDAPLFKRKIVIENFEIVRENVYSWRLIIKSVRLVDKV